MQLVGCICADRGHEPSAHDDGFGCTYPGCPCIARWRFTEADEW